MRGAEKKCKSKTRDGRPCPNAAGASGYCFTHDPTLAAERTAARKLGGWHRTTPKVADPKSVKVPIRDIPGVLAVLDVAVLDTMALDNSSERSRALTGVALAYLKALEVGALEERLAAIEQALKDKDESRKPDTKS